MNRPEIWQGLVEIEPTVSGHSPAELQQPYCWVLPYELARLKWPKLNQCLHSWDIWRTNGLQHWWSPIIALTSASDRSVTVSQCGPFESHAHKMLLADIMLCANGSFGLCVCLSCWQIPILSKKQSMQIISHVWSTFPSHLFPSIHGIWTAESVVSCVSFEPRSRIFLVDDSLSRDVPPEWVAVSAIFQKMDDNRESIAELNRNIRDDKIWGFP